MAERKDPPYFMYFKGNYRWSAAMLGMLSTAGWGGSDINEVDKIGRLLKGARVGDDDASNHPHAAAPFYLRACNYYQMGERFRTPKDEKALTAYRTSVGCFHRFA